MQACSHCMHPAAVVHPAAMDGDWCMLCPVAAPPASRDCSRADRVPSRVICLRKPFMFQLLIRSGFSLPKAILRTPARSASLHTC
jgi:hypothetical protein